MVSICSCRSMRSCRTAATSSASAPCSADICAACASICSSRSSSSASQCRRAACSADSCANASASSAADTARRCAVSLGRQGHPPGTSPLWRPLVLLQAHAERLGVQLLQARPFVRAPLVPQLKQEVVARPPHSVRLGRAQSALRGVQHNQQQLSRAQPCTLPALRAKPHARPRRVPSGGRPAPPRTPHCAPPRAAATHAALWRRRRRRAPIALLPRARRRARPARQIAAPAGVQAVPSIRTVGTAAPHGGGEEGVRAGRKDGRRGEEGTTPASPPAAHRRTKDKQVGAAEHFLQVPSLVPCRHTDACNRQTNRSSSLYAPFASSEAWQTRRSLKAELSYAPAAQTPRPRCRAHSGAPPPPCVPLALAPALPAAHLQTRGCNVPTRPRQRTAPPPRRARRAPSPAAAASRLAQWQRHPRTAPHRGPLPVEERWAPSEGGRAPSEERWASLHAPLRVATVHPHAAWRGAAAPRSPARASLACPPAPAPRLPPPPRLPPATLPWLLRLCQATAILLQQQRLPSYRCCCAARACMSTVQQRVCGCNHQSGGEGRAAGPRALRRRARRHWAGAASPMRLAP
eukprot:334998-Chlamydomonas_euryale.AAC.3